MFTFYKKHNNKLYSKLVDLSRNKYFYKDIGLEDKIETRILLIFFHLSLIFYVIKKDTEKLRKQEIFDNVFQNIEYHLRELGHGDVSVNQKMKKLTKVFYDILVYYDKNKVSISHFDILKKYFFDNKKNSHDKVEKLANYFAKFHNFCFDLEVKNMLNGSLDFVYKD
tara:strand:+ start:135 stop:635 length:501 start_codon:yes stop_codon:yes gene_type:complete